MSRTVIEAAFLEAASEWCTQNQQHWAHHAPLVWSRIATAHDVAAKHVAAIEDLRPEIDTVVRSFLFDEISTTVRPKHVEVILGLCRDLDLAERVSATMARLVAALGAHQLGEFAIHGDETTASFENLYVDRDLTDPASGEGVSVAALLEPGIAPARVVVIGDPGTGKSTLVRWLRWFVSAGLGEATFKRIPLVVVCRDTLSAPSSTVLDSIRHALEVEIGESIDNAVIEALLATGQVVLVFDGIDEIQVVSTRTSVVKQLATLARNYPAIPILCTTRRTGGELRGFENTRYRVMALAEYDESQVEDYVAKWFGLKKRPQLTQAFLGESRDLLDLRRNPLMLALLCSLFTQQAYIPQSRREVYTRCAAFMFREWDPSRGIEIPNIFKQRGDRALQAVATAIDRLGGYGKALEESRVLQIVKGVLENAGVETVEAETNARELVTHCSTRAWVLSASTTGTGERALSFTHRTFFEFFAAEATIREINRRNALGQTFRPPDTLQLSQMTRAVVEPYLRDPTSVMPELLVQAADDLMGGVSEVVIDELLKHANTHGAREYATYVALTVRVLAAAGATDSVATRVFEAIAKSWKSRASEFVVTDSELRVFRALLDVPSRHRALVSEFVRRDEAFAGEFQRRYASLVVAGTNALHSEDWRTLAAEIGVTGKERDPRVLWYGAHSLGLAPAIALTKTPGPYKFVIECESVSRAGVIWIWLNALGNEQAAASRGNFLKHLSAAASWNGSGGRQDEIVPNSLVPRDIERELPEIGPGAIAPDVAVIVAKASHSEAWPWIWRVAGRSLEGSVDALVRAEAGYLKRVRRLQDDETRWAGLEVERIAGERAELADTIESIMRPLMPPRASIRSVLDALGIT